jgi:hypothetical protein
MASKKKQSENSLAGWSEIIKIQSEQAATRDFRTAQDAFIKNQEEAAELFHKLWGQSHDSPEYVKADWMKMQLLLDKLGIPV